MKYIVGGKELETKKIEAIDLLCNVVSSTLGPTGYNVMINKDDEMPFITNDGVTIAKSLESDDKVLNTIIDIAKEASMKTDEIVGDGTTTTMVLLQAVLKKSMELSKKVNPLIIKKQLDLLLDKCVKELEKKMIIPDYKQLISAAITSSNDIEIGNLVAEIYQKMKNKYAIRISESTRDTYYEIKKGYSIEIDDISNMYFDKVDEIILSNCYLLLIRSYFDNIDIVSEILNEAIDNNKNIVILANDFSEEVGNEILLYKIKYNKNIFIFKNPEYGFHKDLLFKDLSFVSGAKICDISFSFSDLGVVEQIIINKEQVVFINDTDKSYVQKLKDEYLKLDSAYEKEFMENRISKLENGIATIYVGGNTKTEKKEKIMRYYDALCAISIASKGIVLGEGVTFFELSSKLGNDDFSNVFKYALSAPLNKIINNIGEDYEKISENIKNYNYKKVYNYKTSTYEDINSTDIVDPGYVLIESLKNAISIAGMLITTNYLIINENAKEEKLEL